MKPPQSIITKKTTKIGREASPRVARNKTKQSKPPTRLRSSATWKWPQSLTSRGVNLQRASSTQRLSIGTCLYNTLTRLQDRKSVNTAAITSSRQSLLTWLIPTNATASFSVQTVNARLKSVFSAWMARSVRLVSVWSARPSNGSAAVSLSTSMVREATR